MAESLVIEGLSGGYRSGSVLHGVDLRVEAGEVLALLGRNGMGKSSTLKGVMRLLPNCSGTVEVEGEDISRVGAAEVVGKGVGYVPEDRRIFGSLSAHENLLVALPRGASADAVDAVLDYFPELKPKLAAPGGSLSGGQQEMLAIARALVRRPKILLLDEPTHGLSPLIAARILEAVGELRASGVAVVLVEQDLGAALSLANRVSVLVSGKIVLEGDPARLTEDEAALQEYLAVGKATSL